MLINETRKIRLRGWSLAAIIALQLLFAVCMTSVLVYNARRWAPEVIDFGSFSYRAFNIYVSIPLVGYITWGLARRHRFAPLLLAAFAIFHMIEGIIIGFWAKAVLQLLTLLVLAWTFYEARWGVPASDAEW